MDKNYTYEEIKNEFSKYGYTLLDNQLKDNNDMPLLCLDEQGYKILISFNKFLNGNRKNNRFHPTNPYTLENINHYAKTNNINSICISDEYINTKKHLEFKCSCGNKFQTTWSNFSSRRKIKCDKCTKNPRANKDYNTVKQKLQSLGYYLELDESEYHGVTKTPLICHDVDGYKYRITYDAVLHGTKPRKVISSNPFSIHNINNYLKLNNKDFTCLTQKYTGKKSLLEFVCERCGEHVYSKWGNMYRQDSNSNRNILLCPNCDGRTESVHALVLKQMFLYHYPDTIIEEKSCINPNTNKIMPTDIVNHRLKTAIEIQSEWHDLDYQKIKDEIKKNFWLSKGYKFYSPDIRDYSLLEMCQIFFNITELPEYINYEFSNKLNIKKIQDMLNKNMSPVEIGNTLNVNPHRIYDAIGYGKLHYSNTYINKSYTPVVQLDKNNRLLNEYTTIKEAALENNLNPKSLSSTLLKKKHEFGNYIWYYKTDYENISL